MSSNDSLYFQTLPAWPIPSLSGGGGHLYQQTGKNSDSVSVLLFPYMNLSDQTWAGMRLSLSQNGLDASKAQGFHAWIYNDGNDKWILFDFGIMNEDCNGNGVLDSEPASLQGGVNDYGLPIYYFNSPQVADPLNPGTTIIAPSCGPVSINSGVFPEGNNQYESVGQSEIYTQEGARNGTVDGEDSNGDHFLETFDNYFEYGIRANWTGWQWVDIPVNFSAPPGSSTTSGGVAYYFNTVGIPNPTIIRTLRVWATGATSSATNGYFMIETAAFSSGP